jgi:hypothetical protein
MASTIDLSGLTKYTDQLSQALISEAVLAGTTFKYISLMPGVPYATAINLSTSTLVAQAGGCGLLNATGSVALTQRSLTVCPLKVEENICEDDIKQYWLGKLMQDGSYTEDLSPKQFAQVYTADKVAKLGALIEDYYWSGSTNNYYSNGKTLCNGILNTLEYTSGSASVISGNGTFSGALTVNNALNVIDGMIAALTADANGSQVLANTDLTLFMSYSNFTTLVRALRNVNYFHNALGQEEIGGAGRWELMYPGQNLRIVATRGLNGLNKMVLTPAKNLYYGFDSESDYTKFRIWTELNYDDIRFRAKFKIGAQVGYPQYVVMYK